MTIETLNTFAHYAAKLFTKIIHKSLSMKSYTVQLLPGETIEQASRREGKKMSSHRKVVYRSANAR
jgi:hypothetical protein